MRYVITGGCGFIGSHVVQLLKSKGKKVAVIDKITNRELIDQKALLQNVQHFYMDISDPELMEKALLPDDIVIHLAAQSHVDVSFKNPVQTTVSNVVGIAITLAISLQPLTVFLRDTVKNNRNRNNCQAIHQTKSKILV